MTLSSLFLALLVALVVYYFLFRRSRRIFAPVRQSPGQPVPRRAGSFGQPRRPFVDHHLVHDPNADPDDLLGAVEEVLDAVFVDLNVEAERERGGIRPDVSVCRTTYGDITFIGQQNRDDDARQPDERPSARCDDDDRDDRTDTDSGSDSSDGD